MISKILHICIALTTSFRHSLIKKITSYMYSPKYKFPTQFDKGNTLKYLKY